MDENLISPIIFFKPGQCPYCSGILMVVDSETTCMILGDNGDPVKEDTIMRCEGVCQNCGKTFQMMRYGWGYRIESQSLRLFTAFDRNRKKPRTMNIKRNPFIEE